MLEHHTEVKAFNSRYIIQVGTTVIKSEDHCILEDFVCHIYQPKTEEVQLSRLRWNIFRQNQAEAEKLPPTSAALRQHTLRVHYQCMIWYNDLLPVTNFPSPTSYGWVFLRSGTNHHQFETCIGSHY